MRKMTILLAGAAAAALAIAIALAPRPESRGEFDPPLNPLGVCGSPAGRLLCLVFLDRADTALHGGWSALEKWDKGVMKLWGDTRNPDAEGHGHDHTQGPRVSQRVRMAFWLDPQNPEAYLPYHYALENSGGAKETIRVREMPLEVTAGEAASLRLASAVRGRGGTTAALARYLAFLTEHRALRNQAEWEVSDLMSLREDAARDVEDMLRKSQGGPEWLRAGLAGDCRRLRGVTPR